MSIDTLKLLEELIRIPSVNPALDPEGQGEERVAEFARDWLEAHGVKARLEYPAPGRPNVVAQVGTGSGPTLVLCGHLDTVQTSGMEIPPFAPRLEGDRLYGRGAFDMKGGVAAVMTAAARMAQEGSLRGTLLLALVADEEHLSIGAQDFVRRYRADGCIVAEPSGGLLRTGHRGFAWVDVRVVGVAAHGSRWDAGVSAIAHAGRFLAALEQYDQGTLRTRTHPLLGPASLHPAMIRGGVGLSTYAPECLVQIEWRTLPGQTAEEVVAETRRLITQVGIEADVTCTCYRPALFCPPDTRVRQALTMAIGRPAQESGKGGWTDAGLFEAAGVPALLYGPSGQGAHGSVEWVEVPSVLECAEVYRRAALDFCNSD